MAGNCSTAEGRVVRFSTTSEMLAIGTQVRWPSVHTPDQARLPCQIVSRTGSRGFYEIVLQGFARAKADVERRLAPACFFRRLTKDLEMRIAMRCDIASDVSILMWHQRRSPGIRQWAVFNLIHKFLKRPQHPTTPNTRSSRRQWSRLLFP